MKIRTAHKLLGYVIFLILFIQLGRVASYANAALNAKGFGVLYSLVLALLIWLGGEMQKWQTAKGWGKVVLFLGIGVDGLFNLAESLRTNEEAAGFVLAMVWIMGAIPTVFAAVIAVARSKMQVTSNGDGRLVRLIKAVSDKLYRDVMAWAKRKTKATPPETEETLPTKKTTPKRQAKLKEPKGRQWEEFPDWISWYIATGHKMKQSEVARMFGTNTKRIQRSGLWPKRGDRT